MDEILVETITSKEGATNGKAWKRYGVKDGNGEWYSTFDESLIAKLKEGVKARIRYETKMVNGRAVKNLMAVEEPAENGAGLPEPYVAQRPDGSPDWDRKSLHISRCGLWNNFLSGHLAANLYAKAVAENSKQGATQRDPIEYVLITGTRLVVAAERDVFERPPGDDGVPFRPDNDDIQI